MEAGAYRSWVDLERKILEEPIINVRFIPSSAPEQSMELVEYVPEKIIKRKIVELYAKPMNLTIKTIDELTQSDNALTRAIEAEYEIFDSYFKQRSVQCGLRSQNVIYTQNRNYLLRTKEEAALSSLDLELETRCQENEFHSMYIKALISGNLAEPHSKLARTIARYWQKNNLVMLNNVILESEQNVQYSNGSIKAEAVEDYLKHFKNELLYKQILRTVPDQLRQFLLKSEIKENLLLSLKKELPVTIIDEEQS